MRFPVSGGELGIRLGRCNRDFFQSQLQAGHLAQRDGGVIGLYDVYLDEGLNRPEVAEGGRRGGESSPHLLIDCYDVVKDTRFGELHYLRLPGGRAIDEDCHSARALDLRAVKFEASNVAGFGFGGSRSILLLGTVCIVRIADEMVDIRREQLLRRAPVMDWLVSVAQASDAGDLSRGPV